MILNSVLSFYVTWTEKYLLLKLFVKWAQTYQEHLFSGSNRKNQSQNGCESYDNNINSTLTAFNSVNPHAGKANKRSLALEGTSLNLI